MDIVTGILPNGEILCLLTVHGAILDGSKLLLWSPKAVTKLAPATERSAPSLGVR